MIHTPKDQYQQVDLPQVWIGLFMSLSSLVLDINNDHFRTHFLKAVSWQCLTMKDLPALSRIHSTIKKGSYSSFVSGMVATSTGQA
jgi:hypothetical protein